MPDLLVQFLLLSCSLGYSLLSIAEKMEGWGHYIVCYSFGFHCLQMAGRTLLTSCVHITSTSAFIPHQPCHHLPTPSSSSAASTGATGYQMNAPTTTMTDTILFTRIFLCLANSRSRLTCKWKKDIVFTKNYCTTGFKWPDPLNALQFMKEIGFF